MLESIKNFVLHLFETHRTRKLGLVVGIFIGIAILLIGFFNTLFIILCGLIGLFIGASFDSNDELIEKTLTKLDKILPENIQRW